MCQTYNNIEGFRFLFKKVIDLYSNKNITNYSLYGLNVCLNSKDCYKNKLQLFTSYIFNNKNASQNEIDEIQTLFNLTRKVYNLLNKRAFLFKYKKAIIYSQDKDLYYNNLSDYKSNQLFTVYDNCSNCCYNFRTADLLRIIESSLSSHQDFFIRPIRPKNPFTNLNFSDTTLWNLYIHIALQKTPFVITPLFQLFAKYTFNIIDYEENTMSLLKQFAINDYIANASAEKKALDIREMLNALVDNEYLANIDNDFPNDILINAFSRHLKNYYITVLFKYTRKANIALNKLQNELDLFTKYNPKFGRKIMKITKKRYDKDENGNYIKVSDVMKFKYIFITEFTTDYPINNINNLNMNLYVPIETLFGASRIIHNNEEREEENELSDLEVDDDNITNDVINNDIESDIVSESEPEDGDDYDY